MIRNNSQKEIYPACFYTQVVGRFIIGMHSVRARAGGNGLVWVSILAFT